MTATRMAILSFQNQQAQLVAWGMLNLNLFNPRSIHLAVDLQPAIKTLLRSAWVSSARRRSAWVSWHRESASPYLVHRLHPHGNLYKFKSFVAHVQTLCKMRHPNLLQLRGVAIDRDGAASQSMTGAVALLSELPEASLAAVLSAFGVAHDRAPEELEARAPEAPLLCRVQGGGVPKLHLGAGKTDAEKVGPLDWGLRLSLASDVAKALAYLHTLGMTHGRLSMSNVLLTTEWVAVLADYCGSNHFDGPGLSPPANFYMPEISSWSGPQVAKSVWASVHEQRQALRKRAVARIQERALLHMRRRQVSHIRRSVLLRDELVQTTEQAQPSEQAQPTEPAVPSPTELPEFTAVRSEGEAQGAQVKAGCRADVFAFGRLLCGLALGREVEMSYVEMLRVAQGQASPADGLKLTDAPPEIRTLARRCCARWPWLRPSMDEVVRVLADVAVERRRPEEPLKGWKHALEAAHCSAAEPGSELSAERPSSSSHRSSERSWGKLTTTEAEVPTSVPSSIRGISVDQKLAAAAAAAIGAGTAPLDDEAPSSCQSLMSQGKLTIEKEEVPVDSREAWRTARRVLLTEGDELYEGAKGTKDAPGRCVSMHRWRQASPSQQLHLRADREVVGSILSAEPSSSSSLGSHKNSERSHAQGKLTTAEASVPISVPTSVPSSIRGTSVDQKLTAAAAIGAGTAPLDDEAPPSCIVADELYEGAKGTKDAPGRCVSMRRWSSVTSEVQLRLHADREFSSCPASSDRSGAAMLDQLVFRAPAYNRRLSSLPQPLPAPPRLSPGQPVLPHATTVDARLAAAGRARCTSRPARAPPQVLEC